MKRRIYRLSVIGVLFAAGIFFGLRERPLPANEHVTVPPESGESFQGLEEPTHQRIVSAGNDVNAELPLQLSAIPASRLREQLLKLSENLQEEALQYLAERPELLNDLTSLRVGPSGKFYYVCILGAEKSIPRNDTGLQPRIAAAEVLGASVAISSPPVRHSRPGCSNVLYLDFNGEVVSGTIWNTDSEYGSVASWDCRPYDTDGNETTFSSSEQADIIEIWERVAEDYAPFDVDVTTEAPLLWTDTTGHALITPDVDKNGVHCPHYGAGGLAYLEIFGENENTFYSPAWVLDYDYSRAASIVAEAVSHELGHNLGLHHDGTSSDEYYSGHPGVTEPSWGPIMGTGYNRNISQWSKGEYYNSDEDENDLAILSDRLDYREDDAGDDNSSATLLTIIGGETVSQNGVIERTDDPDVYHFTTLAGEITISVDPYRSASGTWGGNLDLELRLYNEAGDLLESDNPSSVASASIVRVVTAGKYYVHIIPVGAGSPMSSSPTGYTSYGSLGQYFMSGTVSGDGDADKLPTYWEELYFGNADLYGASDDPDHDGSDNYSEFIAGTLPDSAASVFAVTSSSATLTDGVLYVLNWSTVEGRVYSVNYTPNLQYTAFTGFADGTNLPHTVNSYTDAVDHAETKGFYRVDVRLAPE
ncbi:M12 family metallo-peptidase [Pontiellaceae bacterium B1224]|nr:M12 family metallo-peptidase [Pontiellaceae bacterium B1224]